MRINRLKKHLNYQLVAILLSTVLILFMSSKIRAQEIKAPIAAALEKGDTALAIDLLQKEIEIDKSYYLNFYTLGQIHFAQKRYTKAAEQFQLSLKAKKSIMIQCIGWG